jgi:hypothetical protein
VLTTVQPGERTHRWPWFLPDGAAVLFVCQLLNASYDDGTIEAVRVNGGERTVLVRGGTHPRYVEPGYLIYTRQNVVYAVRFDPKRLEVTGEPHPVITGVMSSGQAVGAGSGNGSAQISIASNGTGVYVPATADTASQMRLAILDRTGKVSYEYPEQRLFFDPKFSPDGRRLVVRVRQERSEHLHMLDPARGTLTQIIFDGTFSGVPVWSKNGEEIAYASDARGGGLEVSVARADGTRNRKLFSSGANVLVPTSFSSDGRLLALMEVNPRTNMDILVGSMADMKVTPFLNTPTVESLGAFSPDDKWILYQMVDASSPSPEVFVRSYPNGGGLRQVSTRGGLIPYWTKGGREVVYLSGGAVMAVDVTTEGSTLVLGRPQELFKAPVAMPANAIFYDVTSDGNRFAMLLTSEQKIAAPPRTNLTITFNLIDEIRRVTK